MHRLRHTLSRATYEWAEDGVGPIKVVSEGGAEGRFDRVGSWVAGELRSADPAMCRWIASGELYRTRARSSAREDRNG
ncbi:MAG TPA: hypothetical protein VGA11_05500 [Acidimicrobiia bacterium]